MKEEVKKKPLPAPREDAGGYLLPKAQRASLRMPVRFLRDLLKIRDLLKSRLPSVAKADGTGRHLRHD
jgi:hypothetical protein